MPDDLTAPASTTTSEEKKQRKVKITIEIDGHVNIDTLDAFIGDFGAMLKKHVENGGGGQ